MEPVLTTTQMRLADRLTIEEVGIPSLDLMERAGAGAADIIIGHRGSLRNTRVCCLCGKGNNGGDGLVVARKLFEVGADVTVQLVQGEDGLSPDAGKNLHRIHDILSQNGGGRLTVESGPPTTLAEFDIVVDGLLGTGISHPLREPVLGVVDLLEEARVFTVSLDVPTGLDSDSGAILGAAVRSDITITMGALKQGLLINDGPDLTGRVEVIDIGIPSSVIDQVQREKPGATFRPDHADISDRLPRRSRRSHKYSAGLALVVGGSRGLTGAPVLASTAAARTGAGAVVCACPDSIQPILSTKLTEVMTLALPSNADGIKPREGIEAMTERLDKASAVLVGCGLGRDSSTQAFVLSLLLEVDLPTVVDADGLFALSADAGFVKANARGRWILTPHLGELRRLVGDNVNLSDPIAVARRFASQWNCVLIVKGAPSVVGSPDGRVYINPTGNQGLASAGTGDVLAGMCAGYLAQGCSSLDAALCALYVGGLAADALAAKSNRDSMMAGDLISALPTVLKDSFPI